MMTNINRSHSSVKKLSLSMRERYTCWHYLGTSRTRKRAAATKASCWWGQSPASLPHLTQSVTGFNITDRQLQPCPSSFFYIYTFCAETMPCREKIFHSKKITKSAAISFCILKMTQIKRHH